MTTKPACKDCKHWDDTSSQYGPVEGHRGQCNAVGYLYDITQYGAKPFPEDELAWIDNDPGFLVTRPTFFCAYFEEKTK